MSEKIQLYYHNYIAGRGEFVRLVLEELGLPYEQVQAADMKAEIAKLPGFPSLAPPVLKIGKPDILMFSCFRLRETF
jgi:glutathione S-transferase